MKNKNLLVLVAVGTLLFGVTSATSSYIHEAKVDGINTLSICDPSSSGTKCITMQDRNLGATEAYTCGEGESRWSGLSKWSLSEYEYGDWDSLEECIESEGEEYCNSTVYESFDECTWDYYYSSYDECICLGRRKYGNLFSSRDDCDNFFSNPTDPCMAENGSGVYGNYYQWGNNYGFPGTGSVVTGNTPVDCTNYGPLRSGYLSGRYSSNIFTRWDLCISPNKNLRGGSGDSQENNRGFNETGNVAINAEDRQGPCNTGYHVPSAGEWNKVLEYWAEENELILGQEGGEGFDGGVGLYTCNGYECGNPPLLFYYDFKIPSAGVYDSVSVSYLGEVAHLWSSSTTSYGNPYQFSYIYNSLWANSFYYGSSAGLSVRCFKDSYLSFPPYIESTNSGIQVTVGEIIYSGLSSNIMTVTTNNVVNVQEDKPVAGEVSVSFGENVSAKFSDLVKINVPVEDYDQVIIKVKHAGSSGYNFDGLTTNANASCDANGRPTSSQYNGELITVVNGFASIYTCEASDFVALGLGGGSGNNVSGVVVTLTLTAGENSCTINDYNLGTHNVSAQEQYVSASGQDIACRFLKNSGAIVTLSMGDLVDGTKTIGNQYFTGIVTNIGPSLGSIANLAGGSYNLSGTRAIYTKGENTIGSWTGSLVFEGTIPAGTPSGEYTGAIEIVIQQPTWTE